MSTTRIYPDPKHTSFPTPLTEGEALVLARLSQLLPKSTEIYIQPCLNGLRPDLVLLDQLRGVAVIEVKDWSLASLTSSIERSDRRATSRWSTPIAQLMTYRDELAGLYYPSLDPDDEVRDITPIIIFTKLTTNEARRLYPRHELHDLYNSAQLPIVLGHDGLQKHRIPMLCQSVPEANDHKLPESLARDLRAWLYPPETTTEQAEPLTLDATQHRLVHSATKSGYRRIKGPAGSGKSIVLAARAAQIAKEAPHKNILVITYNRTLKNYLRDLAVRWHRKSAKDNISWVSYHQWAKRVCSLSGHIKEYKALWTAARRSGDEQKDQLLQADLPALVHEIYSEATPDELRYDAILVDEGQDMHPLWWDSLRRALKADGEMMLVADYAQDLYENAAAWTEDRMFGAGFRGPWTILDKNHRIPTPLLPHIKRFTQRFNLSLAQHNPPDQAQLFEQGPCVLGWRQVTSTEALDVLQDTVLNFPLMVDQGPLSWADLVILTFSNTLGLALVERLEEHRLQIQHTFHEERHARAQSKHFFFKGAGCIKATTIYSFKGWESRSIILHIPKHASQRPDLLAGIYVALTRLKKSPLGSQLFVICEDPRMASYAAGWPQLNTSPQLAPSLETYPQQWRPLISQLQARQLHITPSRQNSAVICTVGHKDKQLTLIDQGADPGGHIAVRLEGQHLEIYSITPYTTAAEVVEALNEVDRG